MRMVNGFLAVIVSLFLTGAVAAQQSATKPAPTRRPATSAAAAPGVKTVASMKQIMEAMVAPSSTAIFSAAADAPKDDKGWVAIQNAAVMLTESGNLLLLGDRVKDRIDWVKWSRALVDAGALALNAATDKNAAALSTAGDEIYNTCETCHEKYLPK